MIDPKSMKAFIGDENAEGEGAEGEEAERKPGSPLARFAAVLPVVEQYGAEIQECIDGLDRAFLMKPEAEAEPASQALLQMCLGQFPSELLEGLRDALAKGIEAEDAKALAEYFAAQDVVDDAKALAGWLQRVGQLFASGAQIFTPDLPSPDEDFDGAGDGGESEDDFPA